MPGVDLGINLDSITAGLVVGTGGTASPTWANNLRVILQAIIDDIEAKIGSSEILLDADLEIGGYELDNVGGINFSNLTVQPGGGAAASKLYEYGGNLWFNDSNANQVRITLNGALDIGSTGQITGMSGLAAVTYTGGGTDEYALVDHNGYPAQMDHGPIQLKRQAAGVSNSVNLTSPTLAASYSWTYPTALPASGTEIVTITSTGQLDTTKDPSVTTVTVSGLARLDGGARFRSTGNGDETLDHFEDTGTYTPTFYVANVAQVIDTAKGSYIRIGSWVWVSITLDSASEDFAAGLFQVTLPPGYDADFTSQDSYSGTIGQCRVGNNPYDDASCIIDALASNDPDGRISIYETAGVALNTAFADTAAGLMRVRLSIAYRTDAAAS